jgi:hypothetical protein
MSEGWVCLHRKLLEWEWYDDANTMRLFIHCLLRANHEDKSWRGITIEKGSFITSRDVLSAELGLSVMQIRTALRKLKSTNEITIKTSPQHTVITVINYHKYQSGNQQDNQRVTNKQPTNNQQVTTNNNENNKTRKKKTSKKEKSPPPETWTPPAGLNLKAWAEYVAHREEIKSPMTDLAKTKAANVLVDLTHAHQQACVDKSIANGWKGLFPKEDRFAGKQQPISEIDTVIFE